MQQAKRLFMNMIIECQYVSTICTVSFMLCRIINYATVCRYLHGMHLSVRNVRVARINNCY